MKKHHPSVLLIQHGHFGDLLDKLINFYHLKWAKASNPGSGCQDVHKGSQGDTLFVWCPPGDGVRQETQAQILSLVSWSENSLISWFVYAAAASGSCHHDGSQFSFAQWIIIDNTGIMQTTNKPHWHSHSTSLPAPVISPPQTFPLSSVTLERAGSGDDRCDHHTSHITHHTVHIVTGDTGSPGRRDTTDTTERRRVSGVRLTSSTLPRHQHTLMVSW